MSEPSVYTQFSGMNLGDHGCGAGGEPAVLGGRAVYASCRGGRVTRLGNDWEEVYPFNVNIEVGLSGMEHMESVQVGRSGPGLCGGVWGSVWSIGAFIAGL